METVVFYDPATGRILECSSGPHAWHVKDGRAFVPVDKFRINWDVTHHVVDGEVVAL